LRFYYYYFVFRMIINLIREGPNLSSNKLFKKKVRTHAIDNTNI